MISLSKIMVPHNSSCDLTLTERPTTPAHLVSYQAFHCKCQSCTCHSLDKGCKQLEFCGKPAEQIKHKFLGVFPFLSLFCLRFFNGAMYIYIYMLNYVLLI